MNQVVNPQATQLPAHLQHRQRRNLVDQATGGITIGVGPHISIAENRFWLVDAAGNRKAWPTFEIDLCIIDANPAVSKVFYDPTKPYDPSADSNNAPICYSDNGQGASARAQQPQHTSCQLCPHNAWGSMISKASGKQVKACSDAKKLAVIVPGESLVFLLRTPPASLKNMAGYAQTLKANGADLPDVITRVGFDGQGILKFTPVGWVDENTAAMTDAVFQANGTDLVVGRNDVPWTPVAGTALPGAAAQPALAAPQQQFMPPPAPVQQAQPAPQPFMAPAQAAPAPQFAQPAPMAPPQQAPQAGLAAMAGAAPFGAPTAAPGFMAPETAPAAAPKTRKPRTPKPDAVATGTVAQTAPTPGAFAPPADGGIPPFLQRAPQAAAPPPVQQAQQQPAFGMATAPAPDAGMAAALDAAFQLPT